MVALPSLPTEHQVRAAVQTALNDLCKFDHHLLVANASERSLTHSLAVHLGRQFPGYSVDCEYNRDGFDVKRLKLGARSVQSDSLDAVTVFPDIIVHVRGSKQRNLLVLEAKKTSSNEDNTHDLQKLCAFKEELKYMFAAHIIVGMGHDGQCVQSLDWQ
jgi:hypothetical protein